MTDRTLLCLAQDSVTEAACLRHLLQAYVGLEKLLASADPGHAEDMPPELERAELNAMLEVMNGGLHRQMESLETAVRTVLQAVERPA